MIARPELVRKAMAGIEKSSVTLILGPRECGKPRLLRQLGEKPESRYFDMENPRDLSRPGQPQTALEPAGRLR